MYVYPVLGYRAWHVSLGGYGLQSPIIHRNDVWPDDGPVEAECRETNLLCDHIEGPHDTPTKGCSCGLYAWHTLPAALAKYSAGERSVVGAVMAWGKFVAGTRGFKAQFMQPVALVDQHPPEIRGLGWPALLDRCTEKYQIPVLPLDMLQRYAETFAEPMGLSFVE